MKLRSVMLILIVLAAGASLFLIVSNYTFHDAGALQFKASLNTTDILQNQTIRIRLQESNSLDFNNAPTQADGLRALNLSAGYCGDLLPAGVALYRGDYGLSNLSSSAAIDAFGPGPLSCGLTVLGNAPTFKPLQNRTSYYDLTGYWTSQGSQGTLHRFEPGAYTVVAGDEWGRTQVLHFRVEAIPGNFERSGPVSSFPSCWLNPCLSCSNANTTTGVYLNLNVTSGLDHINLHQVYNLVLNSSGFAYATTGHGWVVSEWTETGPSHDAGDGQVTMTFILTTGGRPTAQLFAYYDPVTQAVTQSPMQSLGTHCAS